MSSTHSNLPLTWKSVKLMEVATLVNGRAYKKDELLDFGPVPVLRVGNFFSNRGWYYSDLTLPKDKYCEEGDLLFAWSASFGPKIWTGPKVIYHYHIWKILTSPEIDKKYLYYLLDSISAEIKSQGNGIAMIHATKGGMEQREIPLPPLAEQQKIAAILDAADQLRQKDQQLIDHYTALSQSLFLEMFGDPFSGNTYPLSEHIDILGGYAFKSADFVGGGVPLIKIGTVNKGYFDVSSFSFLPETFLKKYDKWIVREGDILMSLTGTVGKDDYGNVELATAEFDHYLLNQRVAKIAALNGSYLPRFLYAMLSNKKTKSELTKISRGVRQANISNRDLLALQMIKPPEGEQERFVVSICNIEQQRKTAQTNLKKSESLFNCLLQRAFNGELTSSEAA